MIPPVALLALALGAAAPCDQPAPRGEALIKAAGGSTERFTSELATAEAELGAPLLRPGEANLLIADQARTAASRLATICALKALPPPAGVAPDRAKLKAILDRPEFAQARGRGDDAMIRWIRRLKEWLDDLFQTRQAQSYSELTRTLVLGLALALVVAAALRLRQRRQQALHARTTLAPGPEALRLDSPAEHLARAKAALATDAREAIREGLLGLLSGLERRRLARPDRVKTNRELAAELPTRGASPELTGRVAELLRWYDRTFYSLEPVPAAEAARFVESVGQLEASLGGTP
jgi:Domain of unknown function (DUF4129)